MEKLLRRPDIAAIVKDYPPEQRQAIVVAAGMIAVRHTLTLTTLGNTGAWDDHYINRPHISFCFTAYDTNPDEPPYLTLFYQSDEHALHSIFAVKRHYAFFSAHNDNQPVPNAGFGRGVVLRAKVEEACDPDILKRGRDCLARRHRQLTPPGQAPEAIVPEKLGTSGQNLFLARVDGVQAATPKSSDWMHPRAVSQVLSVLETEAGASPWWQDSPMALIRQASA